MRFLIFYESLVFGWVSNITPKAPMHFACDLMAPKPREKLRTLDF